MIFPSAFNFAVMAAAALAAASAAVTSHLELFLGMFNKMTLSADDDLKSNTERERERERENILIIHFCSSIIKINPLLCSLHLPLLRFETFYGDSIFNPKI